MEKGGTKERQGSEETVVVPERRIRLGIVRAGHPKVKTEENVPKRDKAEWNTYTGGREVWKDA